MNIFGQDLSQRELRQRVGDVAAVGGLREFVLDNGTERGVRAIELRSVAGLEVDVLVDRALDLGNARFKGVPFSWRSGNGFRNPGLHEHNDEQGLSWLRAIDGLLVSGGLDHTLSGAEVDAKNYVYPPKQTVTHSLHGRLTAIPGRLLEAREIWQDDSAILRVRGEVIQSAVFGEHLRLTRTVEIDLDGTEIRLHDVVDNLGFERTPHMFLYHFNFGWPLVDEGTEFVAPISRQLWASDSVREQQISYRLTPEPQPGAVEQVIEHELVSGADGMHRVALITADGTRGVELSWDSSTLPNFVEWQNLREGQYAIGLEPSTHHVTGENQARADGSMIWLEHGESREYRSTIRVLDGISETLAARERIRAIASQPD